ncbi:MBOAT family O-acyltransferase [Phaeocystidibacter luteus]|uniref:MBOAT family protein n=1 Tax=Phaeocystidibacter luteus TaxID=911197 RepID=A0A6N6RM83_9FLAO|nr:MBOAT family O-acyltransferase [Phaeocystidibacter luteus]KAB2814687.1 MBOAT family protein [Phaeocystidibacter luteus]
MAWDSILEYLTYNDGRPLLFTDIVFWVFFAVVLTIYSFVHKERALRNAFLFLASLYFYYKTSGFFFTILLFSTAVDFFIGHAIYGANKKLHKQLWVALSVTVNLLVLGYFKYSYFVVDFINSSFGTSLEVSNFFASTANSWFGTDFVEKKILLPVGISFFTFQTISYSVDIYRGLIKPVKNPLDFGFYVSFFPQLVAGPIVRASEFIPQLYQEYKLTRAQFGTGVFWILNGLLKKVLLADYIAVNFVDRIFENPTMYTGFENMMALFGYSLQVYADFSGYTDIAIGIALLLGFQLPVNFNSPYKASSVAEFWKRWHISLSTWLRDYLYIPIGGNRKGSIFSYSSMFTILFTVSLLASSWVVPVVCAAVVATAAVLSQVSQKFRHWMENNINIMLTMLLGGLWHGSSWNFVIWGGLNGLGLVVYKLWKKISPWGDKSKWYFRAWGIVLTFVFITFTRTWFRNESFDNALIMLNQIGGSFNLALVPEILSGFWNVFLVMGIGMIIHWFPSSFKLYYRELFVKSHWAIQIFVSFFACIAAYQVLSADLQPFIYFAF